MQSPEQTLILRPRLQRVDDCVRPTRAEIDLGAIGHNLQVVERALAATDGAGSRSAVRSRVLAVIKADAYGHGAVPVARHLQSLGVGGFCVSLVEEALELRDAGVTCDILVTSGVYGDAHRELLRRRITPVVYRHEHLADFARVASAPFGVHLKVDTGMGRLGVRWDELVTFLQGWKRYPQARLDALMTHFACADSDADFTAQQLRRLKQALEVAQRYGHQPRCLHAANSAAVLVHPASHLDRVRPGVALFGASPIASQSFDLRPALRWVTRIIDVRSLASGDSVGYGATFRAARACRIATVAVGYGDGLLRALSNCGSMLVQGVRCPIVGRVSMDLTTLDVSAVATARVGDVAVILGRQGDQRIDAEEVGATAGTIAYEVLTNISRRVPRYYVGEDSA